MIWQAPIMKFIPAEVRCNICNFRKHGSYFSEYNARMVLIRSFGHHVQKMHGDNFSGVLIINKKKFPLGKIIPPK